MWDDTVHVGRTQKSISHQDSHANGSTNKRCASRLHLCLRLQVDALVPTLKNCMVPRILWVDLNIQSFPSHPAYNSTCQLQAEPIDAKLLSLTFIMYPPILVILLAQAVQALNFPYEAIQLSSSDIAQNPTLAFGIPKGKNDGPDCKAFPGSDDWPTDSEWKALNETLDGALLKPLPVANVCFQGPAYDANKCKSIINTSFSVPFYDGDPVSTLTQWPEGSTCIASLNAQGNCTQGGFPVYVVNASSVRHVQAGVNFARNRNVRLVIK